ncbi:hypothetical protein QW180_08510 [Vibrio sinaloensis]|nr:hypothetical protein [Vibrio sinaloensis]
MNECYKQIDEINLNPKVSVIRFAEDFDRMLAESRYVIGASGVSNWERFCLKVPASIVSVAENQRELSRYIAELGFVHFLGESEQTSSQTYVQEAHRLVSNWDSLVPFDDLDVDGYGAYRVVEELLDNC